MAWLHEQGYTFRSIPGLTWTEINTLLLGYIVNEEAKADAERAAATGTSNHTQQVKRSHVDRLEQKSRQLQAG